MRTSGYQGRKEPEKPSKGTTFFGFIFFVALLVGSYFLSGFVLEQADLGDLLTFKLPVINETIPKIVFQIALGLVIFFILQFLSVFVIGLFTGRKSNLEMPEDMRRR